MCFHRKQACGEHRAEKGIFACNVPHSWRVVRVSKCATIFVIETAFLQNCQTKTKQATDNLAWKIQLGRYKQALQCPQKEELDALEIFVREMRVGSLTTNSRDSGVVPSQQQQLGADWWTRRMRKQ